jgi:hypothetical protein
MHEPLLKTMPPLVLLAISLILGMYMPDWLLDGLRQAAAAVGLP